MQILGKGLREAVRKCLEHDAAVVIVRGLEALDVLINAVSRGDNEATDVVFQPCLCRRDVVREAQLRLAVLLAALLAQVMQAEQRLRPCRISVNLDVVMVDAVRREETDDRRRR